MKRINDTLSGASEAFANASCPEHRDRSAKTEDRSCEGGTLYQSLWIAGRYALQLAATDAGVPYQAVPEGGLSEWTKGGFSADDALIFVGACGIAVRSIAPYVRDKFQDPAVVCVDEAGQFVIPLLSGHVGGANRLAEMVASGIGAVPVVTTATDVEKKFAVDVFAKDHGFVITDRKLAKEISADILAGEPVGVFSQISDFQRGRRFRRDFLRIGSVAESLDYGVRKRKERDSGEPRPARLIPQCVALWNRL